LALLDQNRGDVSREANGFLLGDRRADAKAQHDQHASKRETKSASNHASSSTAIANVRGSSVIQRR
jgi:hypothetical protein